MHLSWCRETRIQRIGSVQFFVAAVMSVSHRDRILCYFTCLLSVACPTIIVITDVERVLYVYSIACP